MASLILLVVPRSMADPDIWWHLRNGMTMLQQHAFVRHDVYSFTAAGAAWIDHEWMAELAYAAGWKLAGAAGVFAVSAALITAIFLLVLWLCWQASGSVVAACGATVVAAMLSTVSFGPRTLLFGWLCLCVQQVLLERFRQGNPRALLLLPPLYLLWVNLHGSWLIGLGVLLVTVATASLPQRWNGVCSEQQLPSERRTVLLAGCGILAALFANPWGWRLVAYPFNFALRQTLNVASIEEWRSLELQSGRGYILVAALAIVLWRQAIRPRAWRADELLLFAGGLYAAVLHARFLFLFALLGAPIAARSFLRPSTPNDTSRPSATGTNAALVLLIMLFATTNLHRQARVEDPKEKLFPVAALPAVMQLPPGTRLFNEFGWGGFLEWNDPALPVFIDSRTDIFEWNGILRDYLDIIRIRDPLALLDKHRVDAVLFEPDTPLAYLLARSPGWHVAWCDAHSILFRR